MGDIGDADRELDTHLEQLFWMADRKRSGCVSVQALHQVLTSQGFDLTFEQFQRRFVSFDVDGDLHITLDEYLRGMGRPPQQWQKYALYKLMFLKYDKDDRGSIGREELQDTFRDMGTTLTAREWEVLFRIMDINQSGRIEFDEFINFFFNVPVPGLA